MDHTSLSPLLDLFRRGEVSKDIRLLAAYGKMTLRTNEQFVLLQILTGDPDEDVAAAAEVTLVTIPRETVDWYLARADASDEVRAFYAAAGIDGRPSVTETESEHGPEAAELEAPPVDVSPATDSAPEDEAPPEEEERQSVVQKIASLNVAERIALAMKGTREERAILIRDPNKIVGAAVLSSPKLSDTEVESIARMATVSEDVIRMIANSRGWTKNYSIVLGLVKNPKTPVALSMNFLGRLSDKDLRTLSTSRNIPEVLRVSARKKIVLNK